MGVEEKIRKESKNKTEKESKVKKAMKKKLNCERTKKAGGKKKKPTPPKPKPKPKKPQVVARKPTPKRTPQSVYAEHVAKLTAKTPKVSAGRKKHFEKLSKKAKKLKVVATEAKSEHKVEERKH